MFKVTENLKIGKTATFNEIPVKNFKNCLTFMQEKSVDLWFSEAFSVKEMEYWPGMGL